jgi:hypothetical protein
MDFIHFFKNQWNIILGVVVSIIVLLTGVVVEPNISLEYIEGGIHTTQICKFVITAFLLILLIPFSKFNKPRFVWLWWVLAIIMFILTTVLFFKYNAFSNENTVYVKARGQRYVVGHTLLPEMQKHIDSLRAANHKQYSNAKMLNSVTSEPSDLWPEIQIKNASVQIFKYYLSLIVAVSLFITLAMQGLYCSTRKGQPIDDKSGDNYQ